MLRLLRAECLHCGRFKLASDRVAAFATRLRLIRAGDLEGAAAVSTAGVSKSVRGELREMEEEAGEMDVDDDEAARVAENVSAQFDASKGPEGSKVSETRRPRWTAHAMAEARDLVRDFLGSVPAKCENCGCASPKITPEGATRLYRHALSGKQRETNAALGVDLEAELEALARRGSGADGAELAGKEVEEGDEEKAEKDVDAAKKTSPTRNPQQKLVSPDDAPPPPRPYRPRRPPVNSYAVSVNVCEPPLTPTPWRLRSPTAVIVRVRVQVVVTDTHSGLTKSGSTRIDGLKHRRGTAPRGHTT